MTPAPVGSDRRARPVTVPAAASPVGPRRPDGERHRGSSRARAGQRSLPSAGRARVPAPVVGSPTGEDGPPPPGAGQRASGSGRVVRRAGARSGAATRGGASPAARIGPARGVASLVPPGPELKGRRPHPAPARALPGSGLVAPALARWPPPSVVASRGSPRALAATPSLVRSSGAGRSAGARRRPASGKTAPPARGPTRLPPVLGPRRVGTVRPGTRRVPGPIGAAPPRPQAPRAELRRAELPRAETKRVGMPGRAGRPRREAAAGRVPPRGGSAPAAGRRAQPVRRRARRVVGRGRRALGSARSGPGASGAGAIGTPASLVGANRPGRRPGAHGAGPRSPERFVAARRRRSRRAGGGRRRDPAGDRPARPGRRAPAGRRRRERAEASSARAGGR